MIINYLQAIYATNGLGLIVKISLCLAGCTSLEMKKVYSLINMKYAKKIMSFLNILKLKNYIHVDLYIFFFLEWKHFKNSNVNFYYELCCICCFENIWEIKGCEKCRLKSLMLILILLWNYSEKYLLAHIHVLNTNVWNCV